MPVVKPDELRELLARIYVANGVSDAEAEVVSRHQVGANLAGHDSHGVMRTPQYVSAIKRGDIVPGAEFVIERETPSTAVINANWGFGFVMTERAMNLAIAKAVAQGGAGVTIRFQGHVGRLGAYAGMAADRGLIAMMMSDSGRGPKLTVPFGGNTALLGSNPICIAVPSSRHGAVILDMATSAVALGKVQLARQRGEAIPLGWVVDKDGQPTTDPEAYWEGGALLPLGGDQGHKGYGLSFMVEVFCGLLTGLGYGVAADGRTKTAISSPSTVARASWTRTCSVTRSRTSLTTSRQVPPRAPRCSTRASTSSARPRNGRGMGSMSRTRPGTPCRHSSR